ncbi:uncharacterized protein N7479_005370 [Penicillium vulpinum]|uniref:3-hydroxyisobutyrate dehydrogenase n=1 Tax=Penicillium vulpinum TaxID=29845 RepID=A0A1V6RK77_9EURO|nr:uncharacterized protein N7479_005370 [Penicillium vulpinum]KAJ5958220.1 hypothetical protein N7479_005370 [Penicillium vulpinum]OQE02217.1 hypothetical protein PENVUL_c040G06797 [Penicillium vulpinum]
MTSYNALGFIGVGAMGKLMVRNLAQKTPSETKIYINDVNQAAVDELCLSYPESIVKCNTAKEVAEKSDIIFTMLPEGQHLKQVYLESENCISSTTLAGKILIDCSTIDTATCLEVRSNIQQSYPTASFYDAPVSGGILGAEKATLGIFIGCDKNDPNFEILTDILSMLGSKVIACGGPALGLVAKLANNYLSGTITIATAEAMNMGMRAGMDARILAQVITAGSGQNHIADKFNPVPGLCPQAPSSKGYRGGFHVSLMRKDMGLAREMAAQVGAKLVLGDIGLETYKLASEDPACAGLDSRVVYRYLGGNENWDQA